MAVTFIDPGKGSLSDALTNLGTSVVGRIKSKEIREAELAKNPQVLAQLAPAGRKANESGNLESFAAALGVRPEFVSNAIIGAFQPTSQELEDDTFVKAGGPQSSGRARARQAEATEVTSQVAKNRGESLLDAGIFDLEVEDHRTGLLSSIENNEFTRATAAALNVNGVAEVEAIGRLAVLNSAITDDRFKQAFASRLQSASPEQQRVMLDSMYAPGFLNHMMARERLAFDRDRDSFDRDVTERRLELESDRLDLAEREFRFRKEAQEAALNSSIRDNVVARMARTIDMQESIEDTLDQLDEAKRNGDDERVAALVQSLNNKSDVALTAMEAGIIDPLDLPRGTHSRGDNWDLAFLGFEGSNSLQAVAKEAASDIKQLVDSGIAIKEAVAAVVNSPDLVSAINTLDPKDRRLWKDLGELQLTRAVTSVSNALQQAQEIAIYNQATGRNVGGAPPPISFLQSLQKTFIPGYYSSGNSR